VFIARFLTEPAFTFANVRSPPRFCPSGQPITPRGGRPFDPVRGAEAPKEALLDKGPTTDEVNYFLILIARE
jgi:hypothetical protein